MFHQRALPIPSATTSMVLVVTGQELKGMGDDPQNGLEILDGAFG
jgi:hypothetical protein